MEKCRHADEYKAIRKPTCGCETCKCKWEEKQANIEKHRKLVESFDPESVPMPNEFDKKDKGLYGDNTPR